MESPPKFNSSYHMGSLLVSSGLLGDAWEACCGAYGNDGSPFFVDSKDDNTVLISFAPHLSQFQFEPAPSVVGPFGEHEFTPHHPCFGFLKSNTLAHYASWQAFMHLWHHALLQNQNLQLQKALQTAREVHEQTHMIYRKMEVELSKAQAAMAELEWYKKRCRDDGVAYYDSFKQQKSKMYFRADFNRIKLARFWDDTIEMLENHESLQFFHYQGKWIYSATAYRLLVEPLDIADFYGRGKHEVCGHYLSNGRPPRHKILEKWWKDKNKQGLHRYTEARARSRPASLTQDSCFWAYLEEVQHCLERSPVEAMPKLKEFEVRFTQLHAANELSDDVFLDSSSFMQWWNHLPDCYKSCSPIFNIIEKQKKVMQLHFTGY